MTAQSLQVLIFTNILLLLLLFCRRLTKKKLCNSSSKEMYAEKKENTLKQLRNMDMPSVFVVKFDVVQRDQKLWVAFLYHI